MTDDFARYARNMNAFSREDVQAVRSKSVCIVGCGGLGGYVAMSLARFGVGKLILVDNDVFDISNLNRQLFCTETNLGKSKALEAQAALSLVNSDVEIIAYTELLTRSNGVRILAGCDAAVDCLDTVRSRLTLEECCEAAGVPFVHGAIGGFYGQVCSVFPGDGVMAKLYGGNEDKTPNTQSGNPSFTAQLVAALQCGETIKLLTGKGALLRPKLLLTDLLHNQFQTIYIA